jgi:phosphoribosylformylglycinamidine synthase
VLCEAGLLPGVLLRNRDLAFICDDAQHVRVERAAAPFTSRARPGQALRIPIKHGEGRYQLGPEEVARLESAGRVVLRYCTPAGDVTDAANPNGSVANIAGICNEAGNVMGLMPHPEHAVEGLTGGSDGALLLGSLIDFAKARR